MRQLIVASKNQAKWLEIKRMLSDLAYEVRYLGEFKKAPDISETGSTFKQNAEIKALAANHFTDKLCIADDSGLVVEALDGKPGVHSSRFAAVNATDEMNTALLLEKLKNVPTEKRNAFFVCHIAIADKKRIIWNEENICCGKIALRQSEGKYGFGYDPVFIPRGFEKTFADMTPQEKDKLSHRSKALQSAKEFLRHLTT